MFLDELEQIEKTERQNSREDRALIPIDSRSQLDTGFTGRSDCDVRDQELRIKFARADAAAINLKMSEDQMRAKLAEIKTRRRKR